MRAQNIAWSAAGLAAPLLVAAVAIPPLLTNIGVDRFGVLALAWSLIGVAGTLDLGIGRATTYSLAQMRGTARVNDAATLIRVATHCTIWISATVASILALTIAFGITDLIKAPQSLQAEIGLAGWIVALTIPVQALSATFRGINEAFEKFREISLLRIALGAANFLGPLAASAITTHLAALVASLLVARLLALALYRRIAMDELIRSCRPNSVAHVKVADAEVRKRLLSFGGWFTVSCVVSPLLTHSDRFIIGAVVSTSAVATYSLPFEVVSQALILVGAVSSVAFPSLARTMANDPEEANRVYRLWLTRITLIMLTCCGSLAVALPFILPLWIGNSLPAASSTVGQILCIGVVCNAIGSMHFANLHARGRTDVTAKVHLVELPVFLAALYGLVQLLGPIGAAIAWSARMAFDAALLWLSLRIVQRAVA